MTETLTEISTHEELTELLGAPSPLARDKARPVLEESDRVFLSASPFCVMATSAAAGDCDVSPKGDPVGQLVHVLDERTIAIAERPGNRRADGYRNILTNPHVGLIFLVPGLTETLRINGRARLVSQAPWFDDLVVKGHRPLLAVLVEVDEVFKHCAKALLRSHLWESSKWPTPPEMAWPGVRREPLYG